MNKQNFLEEINRAGYDRKKEKKFLENYIKGKGLLDLVFRKDGYLWKDYS